jgi:uncharacterized cupin superfamily protein
MSRPCHGRIGALVAAVSISSRRGSPGTQSGAACLAGATDGQGTLRVAGQMLPVRAGDVIFIPPGPDYPHQLINSSDAPLKYLSVSTRDSPEICVYPDSGKYLATVAGQTPNERFDAIQRTGASLDYWEGEP